MKTKKNDSGLHIYKITFVKNKIDSCKLADDIVLSENLTYQEYNGQLIFALIKAESETKAKEKAGEIAVKFVK